VKRVEVRAGGLRVGQKFTTIHTGKRGVVVERERVMRRAHGYRCRTVRVLILGGQERIEYRTLHPNVLVVIQEKKR